MIKQIKNATAVAALLASLTPVQAQLTIDSWKSYPSYYEPQQIVKATETLLYVRASNNLFSFNTDKLTITTYGKENKLNDADIQRIGWNDSTKRLVVVYKNGNIDLLDTTLDKAINMSSFYTTAALPNHNVNTLLSDDVYTYLACSFGIMKINTQKAEFTATCYLNKNITVLQQTADSLYAQYNDTVVALAKKDNFIDSNNWNISTKKISTDYSDWNKYRDLVRNNLPDGPKHGYFGFMRMKGDKLYTVGGDFSNLELPATPQVYDTRNHKWIIYQDDVKGNFEGTGGNWQFVNMFSIDVDPRDSLHVFAAGRTGLYEYYDGKLQNYFNKDNSPLQTATSSNKYVVISSIMFDEEANLWMLQSGMKQNSLVEFSNNGEWKLHNSDKLMKWGASLNGMKSLITDTHGYIWFVNVHWADPSVYCYDPKTDNIIHSITNLIDEQGRGMYIYYDPSTIAEDNEGNIWFGTKVGLYYIKPEQIENSVDYAYHYYPLQLKPISHVAVDKNNLKWIGTEENGIYVISSNNSEVLMNINAENSPLPSNTVRSIAINDKTGQVFIGTDKGLCSFDANFTETGIVNINDNQIWPPLISQDHNNNFTIKGLPEEATVSIYSVSGKRVFQGKGINHCLTWNRPEISSSGLYIIMIYDHQNQVQHSFKKFFK